MAHAAARAEPMTSVASVVARDLRPLVRQIDEDGFYPKEVLRELGAAGAFAHHTGGNAAAGGLRHAVEAMTEVGATCLSTAFCTWCQDALVWYLDRSENPLPRQRLLDAAACGRQLGGTGLSNPMKAFAAIEPFALKGRRVAGGYRVAGRLPFVSNLDDGHSFASIFQRDDRFELEDAIESRGQCLFECAFHSNLPRLT